MGSRVQLYKIRRLMDPEEKTGEQYYDFLEDPTVTGEPKWCGLLVDAYAFESYTQASKVCERIRTYHRHPRAVYHSVIPA